MKNIYLLIFAVVATIAVAQQLRSPLHRNKAQNRFRLSHSKSVLLYYKNLHDRSLRRHDLSTYHLDAQKYQVQSLNTDHVGFTLNLRVAGLSYNMSMDTGSSDIFIKGQNSPGVPLKKYKSGVDFMTKKKHVQIGYLDGFLQTYEQTLPVQFNGHKFQTPLLVAYTAPAQFQQNEGLIGLSFPQLAVHRPTFLQTLIKNQVISKYAYGMNLNLVQQNRSFVSFGESDPELYQGELKQYSIAEQSEIIISFQWAKIGNGKQMKISKAILDTGNTCISIPKMFQKQILNNFNTENNQCRFQVQENVPMFSLLICKLKNIDELPQIYLSIQGTKYVIQKQFYLQGCIEEQDEQGESIYYCQTYIETVDYRAGSQIFLGDAFFNRFYTFFDIQNKKVGIARNKEKITLDDLLKIQGFSFTSEDWNNPNFMDS